MIHWGDAWREIFGYSIEVSQAVIAISALLIVLFVVVIPSGYIFSFIDRKFSADLQARIGPNRAGRFGLLQPLADWIKLIQKQRGTHHRRQSLLWFLVYIAALFSTLTLLPLSSVFLLIDTELSLLLPFFLALVVALGLMFLGLSQYTVDGVFGGLRVAAQAVSGAFPALLVLLCVRLTTGSFVMSKIVSSQAFNPLSWNIFQTPFQPIACVVFLCSGMVLFNVSPLCGGFSRGDLSGGVESIFYGARLSLFRLGRFYAYFLWCALAVAIFLGGWQLPKFIIQPLVAGEDFILLWSVESIWVVLKTIVLMLALNWISHVNPKVRVDQATDFSWKILSPISLIILAGTAVWISFVKGPM